MFDEIGGGSGLHEEWKRDCTYSPASEVALSKPLVMSFHQSGVAYKSWLAFHNWEV